MPSGDTVLLRSQFLCSVNKAAKTFTGKCGRVLYETLFSIYKYKFTSLRHGYLKVFSNSFFDSSWFIDKLHCEWLANWSLTKCIFHFHCQFETDFQDWSIIRVIQQKRHKLFYKYELWYTWITMSIYLYNIKCACFTKWRWLQ